MKTLIQNGRVVLGNRVEETSVLIEDERIAEVGSRPEAGADRVIDATGCYVLPGFIDFHVHLDDHIGRFYLADTYETGSRVAALNGITTLCSFVTQDGREPLRAAIERARGKAEGSTHTDLVWHLTPTRFSANDWLDLEEFVSKGYRTFKFYTTYKSAGIFADLSRLKEVFERLGPLGVRFLIHCEDDTVISSVPEPAPLELRHASVHGRLRPESAEISAVEAVLELSGNSHVPLHVVHVSTVSAARMLRDARRFQDVTFETCPQYLWLDEDWLAREDGHRWLCSPPLRGDRETFRELARDGAFDFFTTDHCAFRCADKDNWDLRDIRMVANGVAGLGALPHLVWQLWRDDPDTAAMQLATRLSANPALRAGIDSRKGSIVPGMDADVTVLDPWGPEHPIRSSLSDVVETYPGFTSRLAFRHVLLRGQRVVENGQLTRPAGPAGQLLQEPV